MRAVNLRQYREGEREGCSILLQLIHPGQHVLDILILLCNDTHTWSMHSPPSTMHALDRATWLLAISNKVVTQPMPAVLCNAKLLDRM